MGFGHLKASSRPQYLADRRQPTKEELIMYTLYQQDYPITKEPMTIWEAKHTQRKWESILSNLWIDRVEVESCDRTLKVL